MAVCNELQKLWQQSLQSTQGRIATASRTQGGDQPEWMLPSRLLPSSHFLSCLCCSHMKVCMLWACNQENTQTNFFCSLTRCSTWRQKSESGTIGRESKMAGPCFWWYNFWGFWWSPLRLRLLVSTQAEIQVCQSQWSERQTLPTQKTSEKMPDQQLYSVNWHRKPTRFTV